MSEPKRIRFRFSLQTVPHETQTTLLSFKPSKKRSTVEKMRLSDTKTLLENEVRPITTFTRSMMQGYNARLSFYVTAVSDPRFDPLTPPKDLYSGLPVGMTCRLYDQYFTISSSNDHHHHNFSYDNQFINILECLETGVLSLEALTMLEKVLKTWDSGYVICQCTDYRVTPEVVSNLKLEIGPDVLELAKFKKQPTEGKLDFERRVLLLKRPMICTDPTPDVARVMSAVDWRKKMWISEKPKTKETIVPAVATPKRELPAVATHFKQLRTKVEFPESLQQRFASIMNQQKAIQ